MMDPVDQAELLIRQGGSVHLMGIGGIGMAGIARLLKERGFAVSGCDLMHSSQTEWLAENGIPIDIGHNAGHINNSTDWLIRSTAVDDDHPELERGRALGIPVSRRGEVLPALMRDRTCIAVCGSHGKTTTTAIIAQILGCGFCVGGEIQGMDGVARDGELMVVEADESDGTLSGYAPDFSVITNIEYDHMEHHASEEAFIGCFQQLIEKTKERVYYCAADPISSRLCASVPKCEPFRYPSQPLPVSLEGKHNQWNAAAALAVTLRWKPESEMMAALQNVRPVGRRFETLCDKNGVRIISDYAHHPTEIRALIQTALECKPNRLLGVFQPHRYTRTLAMGDAFPDSFSGLDKLWLLPVYPASERPLKGGTSTDLAQRFPAQWDDQRLRCETMERAWAEIREQLREGDMLLIIGAGDILKMAAWVKKWCPGEGSNLRPQD